MKDSSTKSLLIHLCDQMKKLSIKAISVEEADSQMNLVKQANNLYKYELDVAKSKAKYENFEIKSIEDKIN